MQDSKSLLTSKTFWINALTTGVAVLTAVGGQAWVAEHPAATAMIGAGLALLNIGLRYVTTQPIG